MRENCKQTTETKSLMQELNKGGWRKKVKKATAAILAAAMVLTSGVFLPQNAKTAAAEEAANSLTLTAFDNHAMKTGKVTGDFSQTITLHQTSAAAENYHAALIDVTLADDPDKLPDWFLRLDYFQLGTLATNTVLDANIDWATYKDIIKDADVAITITRNNKTLIVNFAVTNGTNSFFMKYTGEVPTDDLDIYLGGEQCSLTNITVANIPQHTVTVNYQKDDGTEAAPSVTRQVYEGCSYSIDSPPLVGYLPETATVTGTMGTENETATVIYEPTETKDVVVHCVSEKTNAEILTKIVKVPANIEYTFNTPTISNFLAAETTKTVTAEENMDVTIMYKPYSTALSFGGGWFHDNNFNVTKSGDFDTTFSFHNVSKIPGSSWNNFVIGVDIGDKGWFVAADGWVLKRFNDPLTDTYSYELPEGKELDDGGILRGTPGYAETVSVSDVAITVSRRESTVTMTSVITGADGNVYRWTATDESSPDGTAIVRLIGESCDLYLYSTPKSDLPIVVPNDGAIEVIGSTAFNDISLRDYDKFHANEAPANDFTVTYKFHNSSAGTDNWFNYAIVVQASDGKTWINRADWWSESEKGNENNTVTLGSGVPVYSSDFPEPGIEFRDTIKDSDVTVTVVREGTTITIYHVVNGTNGKTFSHSVSLTDCPTDEIKVMLGGLNCMVKLVGEDVKNEASEGPAIEDPNTTDTPSTDTPSTDTPSTDTPSTDTPSTDTPSTDTPAEPTVTPSEKPAVTNGDKVTSSGATYKVTSTKNKAVSYTAVTSTKKANVTVPNTVKVTSNGKEVTYKVTTVAKNAFKGNKTVKKVSIGTNITKIDASAFKNCKNLTTIVIKSTKLTSVGKNALSGTNKKLVIKVPAKKVAAYQKLFSGKGNANVVVKKS